jgi:hypothetical protein
VPSTSPWTVSPLSPKRTWTVSAPPTTWALVTSVPSVRTTKPVPEAEPACTETTPGAAES